MTLASPSLSGRWNRLACQAFKPRSFGLRDDPDDARRVGARRV